MSLLDELHGEIEEEKQFHTKTDETLESEVSQILETYRQFEHICPKEMEQLKTMHITPKIIEKFCMALTNKDQQESVIKPEGFILDELVINSFKRGYNNFTLIINHLENILVSLKNPLMSHEVKGEKDILKVKILGDLCRNSITYGANANIAIYNNDPLVCCFTELANSKVYINGPTGNGCGEKAHKCKFTYNKDVASWGGVAATNSTLVFKGYAGNHCAAWTEHCKVYMYKEIGDNIGYDSKNTKFYSPKIENLRKVSTTVHSQCKYFLLDDKDNETEVQLK